MYWHSDDDLGLGEQETVQLPGRTALEARTVIIRGDHIFAEHDQGAGAYTILTPDQVRTNAEGLLAPRVYVDHTWRDSHPHDIDTPCEIAIKVGGWRPQTATERAQVAEYRDGTFDARWRAAHADAEAVRLERAAAAARQRAASLRTGGSR